MSLANTGDSGSNGKRVAVMQPYFFPYAGYYRLLLSADQFVVLDCVQFPRRGRVHRTEVQGPSGPEWLTLPLAQQSREVLIRDLAFTKDSRHLLDQRLDRHAWLKAARGPVADRIKEHLYGPLPAVIDFLEAGLRLTAELLQLNTSIVRSSALQIDAGLKAEDRILAIVEAVGGRHYVNAPGGKKLYRSEAFAQRGISLSFLAPYQGSFFQMIPALLSVDPTIIREDIVRANRFESAHSS
jgi:hypothetical protein